MISPKNLIYSIAATRRLLKVAQDVRIKIQEFAFVIWVWVKGHRPTFISKLKYKHHFAQWRKEQAQGLNVQRDYSGRNRYTVRNEEKNTSYTVQASGEGLACDCEDYKNQKEMLGRGCCKHGYAVLNQIFHFESLQAYLNALGPNGYLRSRTG